MYDKSTERDELRGRFTKWMQVLAYRTRRKYLAACANRADKISLEDIPEEFLSVDDQPTVLDGEESFDFEGEALEKAFARLPEKKRQVLIMLFVQQIDSEEAARELDCDVHNIYKHHSLALKQLREALQGGDLNEQ